MKFVVTARHCEVPDDLKDRAEMVMQRAAPKAHRPHRAEVVFDVDHQRPMVELRLFAAKGNVFSCRAEADDHRTALDRAESKLHNHLDKPVHKSIPREGIG